MDIALNENMLHQFKIVNIMKKCVTNVNIVIVEVIDVFEVEVGGESAYTEILCSI